MSKRVDLFFNHKWRRFSWFSQVGGSVVTPAAEAAVIREARQVGGQCQDLWPPRTFRDCGRDVGKEVHSGGGGGDFCGPSAAGCNK